MGRYGYRGRYPQGFKAPGGEHNAFFQGLHGKDAFKQAGSAHGVAKNAFHGIDWDVQKAGPLKGDGFHFVVVEGGRAVHIHKGQVFFLHVRKNSLEGVETAFSRTGRAGDMVGVISDSALY